MEPFLGLIALLSFRSVHLLTVMNHNVYVVSPERKNYQDNPAHNPDDLGRMDRVNP
jgi:hypothetical protein